MKKNMKINFKINGVKYSACNELSSDMTLNHYLRTVAELRGTKYMCREGGCGACIVSVVKTPGEAPVSVNSCMVSVFSCKDWEISTIESIGNKSDGYHKLQTAISESHGTQCGHCTPGFIMHMYSLLKSKELTMLEIEKSLGSNICRCTGYRPILDAFKKFAKDAPKESRLTLDIDIEDLPVCKNNGTCNKTCLSDDEWCFLSQDDVNTDVIRIDLKDKKIWFRVYMLSDVIKILIREGTDSYMLVGGNTGKGVYPIDEYPRILIDITAVPELKGYTVHQNLTIGSGETLTKLLEICETVGKREGFSYLSKFAEHILLVAHYPVRNIGTIAGNLMLKNKHNMFSSDIFLLFASVGAELTIIDTHIVKQTVTMEKFLTLDMKGKIMLNVILPPLSNAHKYVTYKIMPRYQATYSKVNAAFLYKLDSKNTVEACRIVYGGLSPKFIRATSTEKHLIKKQLFSNETLQSALKVLDSELVVTENLPEPPVEYRKMLAINLFYKSLLSVCPTSILNSRLKSGAGKIRSERGVSFAKHSYDTDASIWPLNQPVTKLEALIQSSGEAKYTDDIPREPREVYAALVLSTVGTGTIVSIDAKRALKVPGVIAFYSANEIPGENSFTPGGTALFINNEEVFASKEVKFFNQPIGVIVADDMFVAERAAKIVDVKYSGVKVPVIDIKYAKTDSNRCQLFKAFDATEKGTDVTKVIKTSYTIYGQYHMTMETLACVSKPTEQGMLINVSTQWMDGVQQMISRALLVDANRIDIETIRSGGGFGIRVSRTIQIAVACALVTHKLRRPCRLLPPLTTNMRALGKRYPCSADIEFGVNNSGVIQYMNHNLFEDNGFMYDEIISVLGIDVYSNCYKNPRWNYKCYDAFTDTAKNSWCRSPGSLENIAMAETVMEQISYELNLDPLEVRLANLDVAQYGDLKEIVTTLKKDSSYDERRAYVIKFNKENRWRKRGLRFTLMKWAPNGGNYLTVHLAVYNCDGTVAITHGGIEMGQGINTKAAQICAYFLKIPLSKVIIKGNNSIISANSYITAGSSTSQYIGIGVQRCCEQLLERLAPIRARLNNPTWEALIQAAYNSSIDLQVQTLVGRSDAYSSTLYGVALAEVEVDVLTGETEIIRVDLTEDVGRSVSPEIDVGQVEGAFIMGVGYWTSENLVYDKTGELLTNRTWNYYVPLAMDIPQDFRISFRKNSMSDAVVLGSKVTGEPPTCMGIVVPFAIREAIVAARTELGIPATKWFNIDGPYGIDKTLLAISTSKEEFKFN